MLEENLFENVLASLRVRKGWTQDDAIAHLGISRHTYSDWETGKRLPTSKQLIHIATTFKLSQEDTDTLYLAAAQAPPKLHNLPFPRNPLFTGREAQLERLNQSLTENGSVALTQPVSISGLGGIGKTQLALEYAYRCFPKVYRAVLWVNAADRTVLEQSYGELAEILLPEYDEQELDKRVRAVIQYLEDHTNWLLIMDNADNLQIARALFPKVHQGHILLTTRSQIVSDVVATQIDIDKMEPEEGLVFLLRRSRMVQVDAALDTVPSYIRETALDVVKLLDGHPLALDQAGAYIEETGVSFTEYINLYNKQHRLFLAKYGALEGEHPEYSQHPETVVVTFELCFKQARMLHPLATDILHFCAFLQPDAIPDELFQHDDGFMLNALSFNAGIAALQRYSLIKRNTQEMTLSMHRLVQAVLIDTTPADLQKQWRARVVRALNAAFPKEGYEAWKLFERLLPHALVYVTWTDDELTPTAEVADFLDTTGRYLLATRGRYSDVEPLLFRSFVINMECFGLTHPVTVRSRDNWEFLRSIYKDIVEHTIPLDVLALHIFTKALLQQGEIEKAEAVYQHALYEQEQQLGAKHPVTRETRIGYATFLLSIGREAEAEALAAEALAASDEPSI